MGGSTCDQRDARRAVLALAVGDRLGDGHGERLGEVGDVLGAGVPLGRGGLEDLRRRDEGVLEVRLAFEQHRADVPVLGCLLQDVGHGKNILWFY